MFFSCFCDGNFSKAFQQLDRDEKALAHHHSNMLWWEKWDEKRWWMAKRERNVIKDLLQCFQLFCQCKQFNDATSFHALQSLTLSLMTDTCRRRWSWMERILPWVNTLYTSLHHSDRSVGICWMHEWNVVHFCHILYDNFITFSMMTLAGMLVHIHMFTGLKICVVFLNKHRNSHLVPFDELFTLLERFRDFHWIRVNSDGRRRQCGVPWTLLARFGHILLNGRLKCRCCCRC